MPVTMDEVMEAAAVGVFHALNARAIRDITRRGANALELE
jgi:hypothetical protein